MIENPILPGFNPDPSICRVGGDYYIATSTFEWYPGVQIHHSTDLVNWRLVTRPLSRATQLDMRGNPDSCGIWAPCLSHADGLFWLVYTDVKRYDGSFKDAHNYIVTAPSIDGPWSDPVYVNSSGFDPTLFHDDDGRKYFANMRWNHRPKGANPVNPAFDGILLQEYDAAAGELVGPVRNIFDGTPRGLTEGPHLFKRDGWYYLTVAEGGTSWEHAVTMARSLDIWGPYDPHPDGHLMTADHAPEAPLQRTGHGQMVETPDGRTYHTFLCGRPLSTRGRCPLGRETGIVACEWGADGWLRLSDGRDQPALREAAPDPQASRAAPEAATYRFDGGLPLDFQWLRTPAPDRIFATGSDGLTLFGRESIGSWFEQALVARRQTDFTFTAETELSFAPESYQQAAGLTHYYNTHKFFFLAVTREEGIGRCLTLMTCPGRWPDPHLDHPLPAPVPIGDGPVRLRLSVDRDRAQFSWAQGPDDWQDIGPVLDASLISDEAGRGAHANFTGAFVGMAAFDISGQGRPARFPTFTYTPGT
ncbi:glycoside hydrolase family 43 protein [Oceanomicrobium pacificus]|uniref:Family 43 glycosylhydrolase n=1 Tax=Oceanomicrobium pacificus TaxID=2692916 RepID=A0A6B0TN20_9RHOB|nr:glycoside hydrolase family 43 protein [Oceanomicrobium pacificus]MXU65990.1 family 43 glycosylhydrolase [Oceanomicrobium pacificus]